jgi:hypothetical protein
VVDPRTLLDCLLYSTISLCTLPLIVTHEASVSIPKGILECDFENGPESSIKVRSKSFMFGPTLSRVTGVVLNKRKT